MNWDQIEGQWKRFTGSARERWGRLTGNDWKAHCRERRISWLGEFRSGTEWRRRRPKSRPTNGRTPWSSTSATGSPPPVFRSRPPGPKECGSMKPAQAKIADLWCRLMHTAPMWPSHGQYECRTCGRRHPVCWEAPSAARAAPSAAGPAKRRTSAPCYRSKIPRA